MYSLNIRTHFINYLKENDIAAVFHYLPLHKSEMGCKLGGEKYSCPVTEDISNRFICLPFFNNISQNKLIAVTDTIQNYSI